MLALLIVGCAARQTVGSSPKLSGRAVVVRDFLHRDEFPPAGMGAYGYLVLTHRSTEETRPRFLRICRAYVAQFEPLDEVYRLDASTFMVTYWPLSTAYSPEKGDHYCDGLIDDYDYRLSNEITSAISELDADGPLLVAWSTRYVAGMDRGDALVLDLSQYGDADIERAFRIWKGRIAKGPPDWHDGFFTERMLENIRNLFQHDGLTIANALKMLSLK